MSLIGSQIIGQALRREGVDTFFYIMGGPMMDVELSSMKEGVTGGGCTSRAGRRHDGSRLRETPQ